MKTILILDQDSAQQNLMNQHLTSMGFTVRSIFNAEEFDGLKEKPFMIILDEKMENDDNSMTFLKKVNRKMSRVPVLYMVGRPDKKMISDAKKNGAYEVIEKNSAAFVNLRTTLDKLMSAPVRSSWFSRLFTKNSSQNLPALSV